MLYKNLTAKELYASIYATSIIEEMFVTGLKIGSTQLAVSAMEELIVRENTDIIQRELDSAFKEGYVKIGTSMSTMIARSLSESCREADPFLQRFGKFLFRAKTNNPFNEFIHDDASMRECVKQVADEIVSQLKAKMDREELCEESAHKFVASVIEDTEPKNNKPKRRIIK